jgi:hypothetical protein
VSLSALMRVGLVEAAFSRIRGRVLVLTCRADERTVRITMSQDSFADRYSL